MPGPSEQTPILGVHEESKHFPEPQFRGHGSRLSTRRSSALRASQSKYDDDEEILDFDKKADGDSDFSALMNLVTGAIGSGVVYLPFAAGQCGLILGLILICLMGFVSAHSTTIIGTVLLMARNLAKKSGKSAELETFEDISEIVWGKAGFWVVSFLNYLDLYLTVAVFMGTLAATVNDAITAVANSNLAEGKTELEAEYWWLVVGLFGWALVVFPLCMLKKMDAIAKMSLLGVAANVIILICVIVSACQDTPAVDTMIKECYDFATANPDAKNAGKVLELWPEGTISKTYFNVGNMWSAYGNFGFSFAVAVVTPSLVVGMRNPSHLGRVVWLSHFIITAVYAVIILVSWMAWGNGVMDCRVTQPNLASGDPNDKGSISLDDANIIGQKFMPTLWIQLAATTGLMVSIVSSVPLFFFSIATMVEAWLQDKWPSMEGFMLRLINRAFLLVLCLVPPILLNMGYPKDTNLGTLQGLTGAVTTTTICSILPNVLYFLMSKRFPKGHKFHGNTTFMLLCALGVAVGVFTAVVGFLADGMRMFGVQVFG